MTKKKISLKKLTALLLTASIFLTCAGVLTPVSAYRHESGGVVARAILDEGIVLMKNEGNALPLQKGERIALFGEAQILRLYSSSEFKASENVTIDTLSVQHGYIPYSAGSSQALGEGGVRTAIDPLSALQAAEAEGRVSIYAKMSDAYGAPLKKSRCDSEYKAYEPTDADVNEAAANADTAIVFIRRWDGECIDLSAKDWNLTKAEETLLRQVSAAFGKVVVVLNTPAPIATDWAKDELDGIHVDAVLFAGYGGMQGGLGIADVLLGDVNPSGKLVDTYAKQLKDYPTTATFSSGIQKYTEDIFLGYRYFETFDKAYEKVNYEFGFGLSYTTFELTNEAFSYENGTVTVAVNVKNTGAVAGKETVKLYVAAPQGVLGKAAKSLCAFQKTGLLEPGASEKLTLTVPLTELASFDDLGKTGNKSAYVLEAGDYVFLVGNSVRNVTEAGRATVENTIVTRQLTALCQTNLDKRLLADGSTEELPKAAKNNTQLDSEGDPHTGVNEPAPKDSYYQLSDVVTGKVTMQEFVAQMTTSELASFFVSYRGNRAGADDDVCKKYGLKRYSMNDGPHGFNTDGTSFPCETILACTWNLNLATALGLIVGAEGYAIGSGMWLAPAMNLHRNPLAGRNSEYYSEDPLISGLFAVAEIQAAQSMGLSACAKHFVCNEKEANKLSSDSRVSERALRELYLKPFELAVTLGHVTGVMSSYNLVNGVPTSENAELLRGILRDELGFEGVVTGDWNNDKNAVTELNAGNNIREPYTNCDISVLQKAIANGKITRETLEEGASRVLYAVMRARSYYLEHPCEGTHRYENGVCAVCHNPDPENMTTLSIRIDRLLNNIEEDDMTADPAGKTPAPGTDDAKPKNLVLPLAIAGGVLAAAGAIAGTAIAVKKKKQKKQKNE